MSSEEGNKIKIPALKEAQTYNRWCFLVKLTLQNQKQWDDKLDVPTASTPALMTVISSLHQDLQEQLLNTLNEPTAPLAWSYLKSLFITSDLSSKSTAFNNLMSFSFQGKTMAENKALIKSCGRELSTSFKNAKTISIDDLLLLISLSNLPLQFHHLRATLEEMDKPTTTTVVTKGKDGDTPTTVTSSSQALTLDSLFESLIP